MAESRISTHWGECWRVHHECAVTLIERLFDDDQTHCFECGNDLPCDRHPLDDYHPGRLVAAHDTSVELHNDGLAGYAKDQDNAKPESEPAHNDACNCPCHQVVQPGLVPCPRCEHPPAG